MLIKEKRKTKLKRFPLMFILPILLFLISMHSQAWAGYTYTELLPPDWNEAWALAISNNGVVVGSGNDGTTLRYFIYSGGTYTTLLPPGWDEAYAYAINNNGVVVGGGYDGSKFKGFIYNGATYTELLPPGWVGARARGINDHGVVVGVGDDGTTFRGFTYSEGTYTELPLPSGWVDAYPEDINNNGVVVGRSKAGSTDIGFIYSGTTYTELLPSSNWVWVSVEASLSSSVINDDGVVVGNGGQGDVNTHRGFIYGGTYTELLPPNCDQTYASAINNNGVVIGNCFYGTTQKGFIYNGGTYTELLPPGCVYAYASAINNSGVVVGRSKAGMGTPLRGFIYSEGTYTELLPLGWVTAHANAINDKGVVVGEGSADGTMPKGFIATPASPREEISMILQFFDQSVDGGSLMGNGPGKSAKNRLNALRNMLLETENLINNGSITEACQQLMDAYKKTDGKTNPPDFATGPAAEKLASMIKDLRSLLGCQ